MKRTTLSKLGVWTIALTFILSSCKKEEIEIEQEPKTPTPISVLKDGAMFETVFDEAQTRSVFSGGFYGKIGLYDFTIENNQNLHLAYYVTTPTQQDDIYSLVRKSIDLSNRAEIPQPKFAGIKQPFSVTSYGYPTYRYLSYSNVLAGIQSGPSSDNYTTYLIVSQDLEVISQPPGHLGPWDASFGHIVRNTEPLKDGTFSTTGAYKYPIILDGLTMFRSPRQWRPGNTPIIGLNNVYLRDNWLWEYSTVQIDQDSVFVIKYEYTQFNDNNGMPTYTAQTINKIPQLNSLDFQGTNFYTIRHYSPDGSVMTCAYINSTTNKISTYRYDIKNNVLEQKLSNVSLEYSGQGSDIELDEDGNIYYSGYANNGNNTSGVSIYKKSSSSLPTIVGSDDFLKAGTVVGIKYLFGKVYIAVTANQTNPVHQISIIRQK